MSLNQIDGKLTIMMIFFFRSLGSARTATNRESSRLVSCS